MAGPKKVWYASHILGPRWGKDREMIQKPTTLVLGAGASMPYGFPSGKGLKEKILNFGPEVLENIGSERARQLHQELKENQLREFQKKLLNSSQPSVDAFLEHRPEFMVLGKLLIAVALIEHEDTDTLVHTDDWYQYLWKRMDTSFSDFHGNQLSIITFNYDRSLEHFLHTALVDSYSLSEKNAAEKLKRVPIIHVYGQLGLLEWQANDDEKANVRPYSSDAETEDINTAARGIQILSEGKSDKFSETYRLMGEAELVYFLGFGYNETNMERLNLTALGSEYNDPHRYMGGSCYDLTEAEKEDFQFRYAGLKLGDIDHTAHAFLRNERRFLRS